MLAESDRYDPAPVTRLREGLKTEAEAGFSGAMRVQQQEAHLIEAAVGSIRGVAMTVATRFWIASIGKQFASAALFACHDERLVDIDGPIARYVPFVPADKQAITLRQLLAHLSGLPQSYVSENAANRADAITSILNQPLAAPPGTRFIYSNDNYQLAAAIVEIITRQSYRTFVRTELLSRAGLQDTDLVHPGQDAGIAPSLDKLPKRLTSLQWGQQGWYSTAGDLATWYQALRSGKILSAASLTEMFRPMVAIQEGSATPGWFVGQTSRGEPRIFVRGNEDFGANGLLYAYPRQGFVVAILTHAGYKDSELTDPCTSF